MTEREETARLAEVIEQIERAAKSGSRYEVENLIDPEVLETLCSTWLAWYRNEL